jgi:aspartate aminotransferase
MTGWRIGYAAGPASLVKAMNTVQSQSCTSVAAPMQAAALAALTGPQDCVAQFRAAFERRRDVVVAGIARIDGLTLPPPEGAFYAYIGCADLIGRKTPKGIVLTNDVAVSDYLLAEGHVSSVPGTAYGLSPFFRISTATSDEILIEAIARIGRAVAALQPAEVTA